VESHSEYNDRPVASAAMAQQRATYQQGARDWEDAAGDLGNDDKDGISRSLSVLGDKRYNKHASIEELCY
jgi:hypothetical protein